MIRRPPISTRTDTLFPTRRSSDLDLLLKKRTDVRLLANNLLCALPEFAPLVVPVDVFRSGVNSGSIRAAIRHLKDGGALIIFPAGEVSRVDWQARQKIGRAHV